MKVDRNVRSDEATRDSREQKEKALIAARSPCAEVREPIAALRSGLIRSLEQAGFDVVDWTRRPSSPDVRLWATGESSGARAAAYDGAVPLVLLLDNPDRDSVRDALARGANAVVRRGSPAVAAATAIAVLSGHLVIPFAAADVVADPALPLLLSRDELRWMRGLAGGDSVRSLCDREGFSEREMHRRLKGVYGKLGASGRAEALVRLARADLLRERAGEPEFRA